MLRLRPLLELGIALRGAQGVELRVGAPARLEDDAAAPLQLRLQRLGVLLAHVAILSAGRYMEPRPSPRRSARTRAAPPARRRQRAAGAPAGRTGTRARGGHGGDHDGKRGLGRPPGHGRVAWHDGRGHDHRRRARRQRGGLAARARRRRRRAPGDEARRAARPAHVLDGLAELVCSNSLRSDNPANAVGLLHEELRRLGSLVLAAADETRVPAGDALAVDRERFSALVTQRLAGQPARDAACGEEVTALPPPPGLALVATGPLTARRPRRGDRGARRRRGSTSTTRSRPSSRPSRSTWTIAYARSRWGKGSGDDYLNLPLDEAQYRAFVEALVAGEKVDAARVRGAALLRGLPADRGDGGARARRCSRTGR